MNRNSKRYREVSPTEMMDVVDDILDSESVVADTNDDQMEQDIQRALQQRGAPIDKASVDRDIWKFLTTSDVTPADLKTYGPHIERKLNEIIDLMESADSTFVKQFSNATSKETSYNNKKEATSVATYDEALLEGLDVRSYQQALLEIAIHQNTIVHLGTGTG
jgi:RNA polymerase-interacting CarD/CdnL/TRCF family regulator